MCGRNWQYEIYITEQIREYYCVYMDMYKYWERIAKWSCYPIHCIWRLLRTCNNIGNIIISATCIQFELNIMIWCSTPPFPTFQPKGFRFIICLIPWKWLFLFYFYFWVWSFLGCSWIWTRILTEASKWGKAMLGCMWEDTKGIAFWTKQSLGKKRPTELLKKKPSRETWPKWTPFTWPFGTQLM